MFNWFRRNKNTVKATLRIVGGPRDGTEVAIKKLPMLIGRSPEADLVLRDRWVSRLHCDLYESDGQLAVHDRNSKHGLLVNGEPVTGAVLRPGDRLSVGMTTLVAVYPAEVEGGSSSTAAAQQEQLVGG